jgi:hypothetical protein
MDIRYFARSAFLTLRDLSTKKCFKWYLLSSTIAAAAAVLLPISWTATSASSVFSTSPEAEYECDIIELNHVHSSDDGSMTLKQLIFWGWNRDKRCYCVQAWVVAGNANIGVRPDGSAIAYVDYRDHRVSVSGKMYRVTWTVVDKEVENRKLLRCSMRTGVKSTKPNGRPLR